jgi:hypothetical protein
MPIGRNDVTNALQVQLVKFFPASESKVVGATYRDLFRSISWQRYQAEAAGMASPGSLKQFGAGTPVPDQAPFQTGKVTITPVMVGGKRSFEQQTVDEVMAAGNGAIEAVTDNWASAAEVSKDKQAATILRDNSSTGTIDGAAIFATHNQRSKYADGNTYANQDAVAEAISDDTVKAFLKLFEETIAFDESGTEIDNVATHAVATSMDKLWALQTVLKSVQTAGAAMNDVNVILNSGTQYWYLAKAQAGLIFVDKQANLIETWYDPDTKVNYASLHYQAAPGVLDWRNVARKALA